MFKILREVWMNIGVEKLDMHEDITIKALLDSGATGMFIDKRIVARHGFKLQKLERSIAVRNVNGTNNSRGAITYQVEANIRENADKKSLGSCYRSQGDIQTMERKDLSFIKE